MSNNRPVNGNTGYPGIYSNSGNPHISAFNPNGGMSGMPQQGGFFPGIDHHFMQPGMSNLPAVVQPQTQVIPAASASKGLFGGALNMTQIKTFVDRMGGIEGIISTVTKVQNIMNQFSQVAPMLKVLLGSFGGAKGGAKAAGGVSSRPRKRRKPVKKSVSVKKSGTQKRRRT